MVFTVTYRGADGAVCTEVIEAVGRAECLAQMRRRGIAPISVNESSAKGACKPTGHHAHPTARNSQHSTRNVRKAAPYAIFVLLVALLAGGLWWWTGRTEARPSPKSEAPKKTALSKEVKPAAAPKPIPAVTNAAPVKEDAGVSPSGKRYRRGRKIPVRIERVSDKIEKRYYEDGTWETVAKPYALREGETPPKKIFNSRVENYLALFAVPGEDLPPIPFAFRDEEVRRVLDTPININMQEDDEDTVACKRAVMMLKEELRKAMDSGMSADDFAERLQSRQRSEAEQVRLSKRLIQKELKDGNRETAQALLEKLNEHLAGQGIPPLVLTKRMREQLGVGPDERKKGDQ